MPIKAVLFDKDGTLIDFFSLWKTAAEKVIPKILILNKIEKTDALEMRLLNSIGVYGEFIDPMGALAYKTYDEIGEDLHSVLNSCCPLELKLVQKQVHTLFDWEINHSGIAFIPLFDLELLFSKLKEHGIKIGLATADTIGSAKNCLDRLEITSYFDYIGADGTSSKPKPHPDMWNDFCTQFHLLPEEVAMVGDTRNDMLFAKQCGGITIGVLSGVSAEKDLNQVADYIFPTAGSITNLLFNN